ncbi:sugar phosphate isomerase/epimerase family protein [Gryllotalpicola protaetiae]|nr:TIM barrel protein [Gryllotalpicola protaetiae]
MSRISITNSVFGSDAIASLELQQAVGVTDLDLKDGLFGRTVVDLGPDEARRIAERSEQLGLNPYSMSTTFFDDEIAKGEQHFREQFLDRVGAAIEVASIVKPDVIRLMAAQAAGRQSGAPLIDYLDDGFDWVIPAYREAIGRFGDAGFGVVIENEVGASICSSPADVLALFDAIADAGPVSFTWDIQNMWETGHFPSLEVFEQLRPVIGYVHVKGGAMVDGVLHKASLRDADWPVLDIVRAVHVSGVSPVICVNPCHGRTPTGYNGIAVALDDIRFVAEATESAVAVAA